VFVGNVVEHEYAASLRRGRPSSGKEAESRKAAEKFFWFGNGIEDCDCGCLFSWVGLCFLVLLCRWSKVIWRRFLV